MPDQDFLIFARVIVRVDKARLHSQRGDHQGAPGDRGELERAGEARSGAGGQAAQRGR